MSTAQWGPHHLPDLGVGSQGHGGPHSPLTCRMAPYSRSSTSRGSSPTLGRWSGSEQRKSRLLRPPLQTHNRARSSRRPLHRPGVQVPRPAPRALGPPRAQKRRESPGPEPNPARAQERLTPDLPPHGVNPQLLRPRLAPGPAQVLSAPLVGAALGVSRARRAAPPAWGHVGALSLQQAVLGQAASERPASDHIGPLGRHGSGAARPTPRRRSGPSGALGSFRPRSAPLPASLRGSGRTRVPLVLLGSRRRRSALQETSVRARVPTAMPRPCSARDRPLFGPQPGSRKWRRPIRSVVNGRVTRANHVGRWSVLGAGRTLRDGYQATFPRGKVGLRQGPGSHRAEWAAAALRWTHLAPGAVGQGTSVQSLCHVRLFATPGTVAIYMIADIYMICIYD